VFQFHFGSIGRLGDLDTSMEGLSFNSTLVRLEGMNSLTNEFYCAVSIPLWFDWKRTDIEVLNYMFKKFQFHFGSIGSEIQSKEACFSRVSIPLWFDWKNLLLNIMESLSMFQFHFGSIGSIGDLSEVSYSPVSIPLWFDWKLIEWH